MFQVEDGEPMKDHSLDNVHDDRKGGELIEVADDQQDEAAINASEAGDDDGLIGVADEYGLIDVPDDASIASHGTTYHEPLPFPHGFQAEGPVDLASGPAVNPVKIEPVSSYCLWY